MALRDILNKIRNKGAKFKEMQEDDRLQTKLLERKKSSNERELEQRMEAMRQERITDQLRRLRERDKVDNRKMTVLAGKNIFKGHHSVLTNNKKLFVMKPTIKSKSSYFHGGL